MSRARSVYSLFAAARHLGRSGRTIRMRSLFGAARWARCSLDTKDKTLPIASVNASTLTTMTGCAGTTTLSEVGSMAVKRVPQELPRGASSRSSSRLRMSATRYQCRGSTAHLEQHRLNFLRLAHGHGSFLPTRSASSSGIAAGASFFSCASWRSTCSTPTGQYFTTEWRGVMEDLRRDFREGSASRVEMTSAVWLSARSRESSRTGLAHTRWERLGGLRGDRRSSSSLAKRARFLCVLCSADQQRDAGRGSRGYREQPEL